MRTVTFCLKICRIKRRTQNFRRSVRTKNKNPTDASDVHLTSPNTTSRTRRQCVCVCVCLPLCSVNTAHPNTVKLISSHHRGSFWLSDKSILSLIISCDTRNHWKAAALNKWHVFCVIILCILTNMTH